MAAVCTRKSAARRASAARMPCANLALKSPAIRSHKEETMRLIIRALALLAFAVTAHAQNISIATGGTGGGDYPLGRGMGPRLVKYVQGIPATPERSRGA